jgi:hypothetical protein
LRSDQTDLRHFLTFWVWGIIIALTWGAAAFGAAYPWAYGPLLVTSALLGSAGLMFGRGEVPWIIAAGLVVIAITAAVQIIPLDPRVVSTLSPSAVTLHQSRDLHVALGMAPTLTLSIDPDRTRLGLAFLGAFGLLLIGTARALGRDSARRLATGIVLVGVVLALVGIIQRATFNGKIYGFWELWQGGMPFGPFVNRNHFAGWMLMGIPVAIGAFASAVARGTRGVKPDFRERLLWFSSAAANTTLMLAFAVLTMALALALTLSRSGILALACALLSASFLLSRRQTTEPRRMLVVAYLLFVAIIVASWVGLDLIASRFADIEHSITERPAIWADTVAIMRKFWLTGTGLNTYGVSTLFYQTALPGEHLREAHNDYLQLGAEGGLLMGIPIAVTAAFFLNAIRKRLGQDVGSIWWIRLGAVTGIAAIALQSLVEFSLQMPGNAAMFAVLCGIALHDSQNGG